jgi:ATP-dependent DNA helicase RecG
VTGAGQEYQSPLMAPLESIVDAKEAVALAKAFDMTTVGDFVSHLPRRHTKRGELTHIANLERDEHVTLVALITKVSTRRMQNRRGNILTVEITDGHGRLELLWFNQAWRESELAVGMRGLFSGKVGFYRSTPQLSHPDYQLFSGSEEANAAADDWASKPIPIYPATANYQSWRFGKLMRATLPKLPPLPDPVPAEIRRERGELSFDAAIRAFHLPDADTNLEPATQTLKFTEAFELQAALAQQRALATRYDAVARPLAADGLRARFDAALPFDLTPDQASVGDEFAADLADTTPMYRLLQGEVGSGKTLVAVRAMLQVAETGGQSVLLAPTEVLATQHLRSITRSLGPDLAAELMPTLLTGSLTKGERQRALLRIVTGDAKIIVGTHALLSDGVEFDDLGLLVIDEQHRFGVEQRERLRRRAAHPPHQLVLTATPIPRTVAMTVFGDLEVSTLRTLPSGRAGIDSFMVGLAEHPQWIDRVWQRTAEELEKGRQAFVVCAAIEPGEREDAQPAADDDGRPIANVAEVTAALRGLPEFAGRRIASLHGRMPADEKDRVMVEFAAGNLDIVVSTTVIEVGVDVPNASVMVELHQLRGRVGRGEWPGVCLLVTSAPPESLAHTRVAAVANTLDGFVLAEQDLELRREGDVLGSAQSGGRSSLRVLRVTDDVELIAEARAAATELVEADPTFDAHPELRAAIERLGVATVAHLEMG